MASKRARKLLKWMRQYENEWYYLNQLREAVDSKVDYAFLQELYTLRFLRRFEPLDFCPPCNDFEDPEYLYRIAEGGKAILDLHRDHIYGEVRAWVTAVIAVAAFAKSFFF